MNPANYVSLQHDGHKEEDIYKEIAQDESANRARHLCKWIKRAKLPARSFLDLGCRIGLAMEEFARHFPSADITGVDIVPQFVERASMMGEALVADMQSLPLDDRSMDWVFSSASIEHCPDVKQAAAELFRVANVGCVVHTDLETKESFDQHPFHFVHHDDPMEWLDILRDPGFQLMHLNVPRFTRIDMLWVRKEHVKLYNLDYAIPVLEGV